MTVHHIDLRRGHEVVPEVARYSLNQYANDIALAYNGHRYLLSGGSAGYNKTEDVETSFSGFISGLYKSNGIVFAIILARMLLFTEGRFCWFEIQDNGEDGRPKGRAGLEVLEKPWPNGGTAELLARMEQDVSLGGNFYAVRDGNRLRRLRPDWVTIVLTAPPAEATESDVAGYWYHPGRNYSNAGEPAPGDDVYLPGEACHWSPIPDPDAQYRGMSWLAPVVREVQADKSAMEHKLNFFANGATFGAIISAKESLTNQQYREWKANFEGVHSGSGNAYKTLFLASPVDTSVMTANMQQLDFKVTVGAGETRLCAAGGVPPIIVGLSEGLASATYSNYGMARRKFGDHWAHPQWKSASQALAALVEAPDGDVRLGVNTKGIAFLREDAKDLAEIQQIKASTLSTLIMAGYTPDSAAAAVDAEDLSLLEHTGLTSVQLVPPGTAEGSVEDEEAGEEYDALLDEFRSRPRDGEIVRKFNPDQPRIPGGHVGGGRWADVGIFTKIFKFGGQEVSVTAHADGDRTIAFGGRSVRLQRGELESRYDGPSSLRSLAYHVVDADVGDKLTVDRYSENYGPDGEVVSVAKRHAIGVRKLAEPPEIHPNGDPDEETWDLTPVSLHLPDDEGFVDEAGITMRQRDIVTLAEQANALVAERIDTPTGSVDVFRDGGKFTIRSARGPDLTFNRKSANALERAFDDLWDEEHRDERPSDVWAERVVSTNLGDVTVRMRGEAEEATLTVGGTTITIPKSAILEFGSALGEWTGSAYRSRLGWSEHDEIQRDRYNIRNPAGSIGGGRFRKLSDVIVMMLREDDVPGDPLADFTQPQLRKAAADLGLLTPRARYSRRQLEGILHAYARRGHHDAPAAPKKAPAKKATPRAPAAKKAAPKPRAIRPVDLVDADFDAIVGAARVGRPNTELGREILADARESLASDGSRSDVAEMLRERADEFSDFTEYDDVPLLDDPLRAPRELLPNERRDLVDDDFARLHRLADALDAIEKAATRKPRKSVAPEATPDPVSLARQRQADIDTANRYADLAGELDESIGAEDDPEATGRRLRALARRHGIAGETDVDGVIKAVDSGDYDLARLRAENLLLTHGISQDGAARDSGRFTPSQHTPIGAPIRQGAAVEVVRPGFTLERDGERIRLSKAVVEEAGEADDDIGPPPAATYIQPTAENPVGAHTVPPADMRASPRNGETVEMRFGIRKLRGVVVGQTQASTGERFLVIQHEDGTYNQFDERALHSIAPAPGNEAGGAPDAPLSPRQEYLLNVAGASASGKAPLRVGDEDAARDLHARGLVEYNAKARTVEITGRGQRRAKSLAPSASDAATLDPLSSLRTLDPEAARDALDLKKVPELKAMLREAGLPVGGRKRELVDRLVGHVHTQPAPEPEYSPDPFARVFQQASPAGLVEQLGKAKSASEARIILASTPPWRLLTVAELAGVNVGEDDSTERVRDAIIGKLVTDRLSAGHLHPGDSPTAARETRADFDANDVAEQVTTRMPQATEDEIVEALQGYTVPQLRRIATQLNMGPWPRELLPPSGAFPGGFGKELKMTPEERRRHIAKAIIDGRKRWSLRSETLDPDDIERADYDGPDEDESEDDPGEPDDEQRARAQSRMDELDEDAEEPDDDEYDMYRAAGMDTNVGGERLHYWWTKGPGLKRWVGSPHPWTTLYTQLLDKVHNVGKAKRMASRWFIEVFGYAAGSDKHRVASGKPPRGDRIGPG